MRYAWRGMPEMGCLPTIIFSVLTIICFPVAIIFILIYSFVKDHEDAAQSAYNVIMMIAIGFVIIASPIVTFISFFVIGFETTIKEQLFLVLFSFAELIVVIVYVIKTNIKCHRLKSEAPRDQNIVYVIPCGRKYHHAGCVHIKNRNDLIKISIDKANQRAYMPCGTCCRDDNK